MLLDGRSRRRDALFSQAGDREHRARATPPPDRWSRAVCLRALGAVFIRQSASRAGRTTACSRVKWEAAKTAAPRPDRRSHAGPAPRCGCGPGVSSPRGSHSRRLRVGHVRAAARVSLEAVRRRPRSPARPIPSPPRLSWWRHARPAQCEADRAATPSACADERRRARPSLVNQRAARQPSARSA